MCMIREADISYIMGYFCSLKSLAFFMTKKGDFNFCFSNLHVLPTSVPIYVYIFYITWRIQLFVIWNSNSKISHYMVHGSLSIGCKTNQMLLLQQKTYWYCFLLILTKCFVITCGYNLAQQNTESTLHCISIIYIIIYNSLIHSYHQ